jgi:Uma2 family endonuclease
MIAFACHPESFQDCAMVTTHLISAAELENMGSDTTFELIQGVLYEVSPSSFDSSEIGMRLGILLGSFVFEHGLGFLTGADGGYRLEYDPDSVIAPDLGFVGIERRHLRPHGRGFFPAPPDLAVEIISPTDERAEIRRKMDLYERTNVPLVWWVDPIKRTATVQRAGQPTQRLTESDFLDGEDIIPGFSIQLSSLLDG